MSTEEVKDRIAKDAEIAACEPAFSGGSKVNRNKQIGYIAGALSERNKTIEQMEIILTRILHTSYHLPEVLKNLESLKV